MEEDSKRDEDDQGRHGKRDAANVTNYLRVRHGGRLLSALVEGCGLCYELRALTRIYIGGSDRNWYLEDIDSEV